jgi:VIT1/CCC1 family predicted Fe2+/Mn2+ transporter
MIDLTPDAKRRFDEYLQRMRASLRGSRSIEADEVEQNVIEHVEVALAAAPSPIGPERLGTVLEQLGPPERWLPDDDRPVWRKAMDRVMTGPDDWRLAYGSLALTLLMVITLPIGGILLLLPAFLMSRAYVALMEERGEALGARKWLILPPIVFVLLLVCGGALIGPAAAFGAILSEVGIRDLGFDYATRFERGRLFLGALSVATGAWWVVLSGVFAMLMRPFRALFAPVTSALKRGHALVLTIAGAVVAGLGAVLLFVV